MSNTSRQGSCGGSDPNDGLVVTIAASSLVFLQNNPHVIHAISVSQPVQSWTVIRDHVDFLAMDNALGGVLASLAGSGGSGNDGGGGIPSCPPVPPELLASASPSDPTAALTASQADLLVRSRHGAQQWLSRILSVAAARESPVMRQFLCYGANVVPPQFQAISWITFGGGHSVRQQGIDGGLGQHLPSQQQQQQQQQQQHAPQAGHPVSNSYASVAASRMHAHPNAAMHTGNTSNTNANANANANNAQGQQEQIDYENIGARGSGCQKSYGEYMLTITEFLEIMAEYHAERFEMYCEYCEECMYDVYQSWMEDMMQNMSEEYAEEMMEQYEQQQQQQRNYNNWNYRKLVEQGVIPRENVEQWTRTLSQYEIAGKYQQLCDEFDSCKVYNSLCKNGIDDDIEEYFECTQANDVYVGPHCSVEDSYTIELGVYYDQYCSDYIGPFVDSVLGQDYAQDPLQDYYHPQEQVCIPCKGFDRDYLTLEEQREEMMNLEYDPDAGINELCEDLYASAMRCDEHFRYYGSQFKSEYYSPQEMELSCQFIESVMNDNFNEFGEVNIQEAGWNTYLKSKSLMWNEYGHNVTDVKPWQIILLILSIGSCVALAMWSVKLHDSLRKGWKPRNADSTAAALGGGSELSREASGIHMARSNGSYYMT
mmetsp:Transcript_25905/g.49842  ORF Transcript_25905/g.49842 Transcript_25905/m.49842 type:complete len:654 (+) Transcript_25905:620-2581(+)